MNVPKLTNYSTDIHYLIMINHSFIIIIILAQPNRNYSFSTTLVWKPILQAKWSNKQKTKVLCIKVHFVHFYPSIIFKNQMCPNTE
jgi:hypothetical protein